MQCLKILIVLLLIVPFTAKAQSISLKILVFNHEGQQLDGACVWLNETTEMFITGSDGQAVFPLQKSGQFNVHVSFLGYETYYQLLSINRDTNIKVVLYPSPQMLRQIVIEDNITQNSRKENTLAQNIVKRDDIVLQSSAGIASAIKSVPGLDVSMIGSGSSKPFIRGLGQNRIAVFEQNIRQESQQWGMDHGLEIDPNIARSIDVVKGPNSLVFGSDAIGGVIVINPPANEFRKNFEFRSITGFESNNLLFSQSVQTTSSDSSRVLRVIAGVSRFADYHVPADSFDYIGYHYPITDGTLKNTAGEKQSVHVSAGYKNRRGTWNITYSFYREKNGFFSGAHGIPGYSLLTPDYKRYNIDLPCQQVVHQKIIVNRLYLSERHWLRIDAAFQNNLREEFSTPHSHGLVNLPQTTKELKLDLNTFSLYIKDVFRKNEKSQLVSGISFEQLNNDFGGYYFLMPRYHHSRAGMFSVINRKLKERLQFSAGVRTDWGSMHVFRFYDENVSVNEYKLRSPEIRQNNVSLTYSAGINFSPNENYTFKINVGKGFRMPLANELAINGVHHGSMRHESGDSTLRPEVCYQIDLDGIFDFNEVFLELSFFASYFPTLIFLNPSGEFSFLPDAGQVYRFSQAKAVRAGGEFYAAWNLPGKLTLETKADYVFAQNIDAGFPMPLTSAPKIGISIVRKWGNEQSPLCIEWENVFHLRQNRVAQNEQLTKASWVSSLMLKKTITGRKKSFDFFAGVYNFFNSKYYNHLSYYRVLNLPEPGINFQIKLIINLSKRQIQ